MRIPFRIGQILCRVGVVVLLWGVAVVGTQERVHAQFSEQPGSVAIVANVGGDARVISQASDTPEQVATLQKPIVYGDRIKTGENTILSMLVGEGALVSMAAYSELAIEKEGTSGKLIQLVKGRSCISTKGQGDHEREAMAVQIHNAIIYPRPGTIFSVNISEPALQTTAHEAPPYAILARFDQSRPAAARLLAQGDPSGPSANIQVLQGSVEVVSQLPGIRPVVIEEGYQVTVKDGMIGEPIKGVSVSCQIQDLQQEPQHTRNPLEIQQLIADQQITQVGALFAAMFVSDPNSVATNSQAVTNKEGVILPFNLDQPGSGGGQSSITLDTPLLPGAGIIDTNVTANVDVVRVVGPDQVEINTSTLTLTNSQVTPGSGNENITLLTVTSGGLLRGTSTDPILAKTDSKTTIQSAVRVTGTFNNIDPSLLEASAPLLRAQSSTLDTAMDAIQISEGQLVAAIPADAVALVELNGSTLSAMGSLFNVSNGGILSVRGNLVSLTNGSELNVGNLVELSGASSFALTGGSLLSSIGANTVNINNTLCASACIGGFISAPAGGNTISVAPGFIPTQGITVSPNAALIVVNGSGNTVVLQN
jgi:hypothetical protein